MGAFGFGVQAAGPVGVLQDPAEVVGRGIVAAPAQMVDGGSIDEVAVLMVGLAAIGLVDREVVLVLGAGRRDVGQGALSR